MPALPESRYLLDKVGKREDGVCNGDSTEPVESARGESLWQDTTYSQKTTFVYVALGTMAVFFCQGIPQPFLSRVVVFKGGERLFAAAIIHSTYFFGAIASLVCGKYQSKIPTKKLVWIGQLILAITQGCFGFLQYFDNIYAFLVLGFLVKAIQGVGQGVFNVAALTLLWQEIPDHVGKSFGMTKVMTCTGFLLGPLLGGYLYSIQNDMLIPFTVSAVLPLLLSFIGCRILPKVKSDQKGENYQTWKYICSPKSTIALGLASTSGSAFAVFDASFTSYAQTMGVSVATVGQMFSISELIAAFANIAIGYFSNYNPICRKFFIAACFIGMFGIDFSFTANESVPALYAEVCIFVVFASVVQGLSFPEMIYQSVGENGELATDFSFRSKLSGVWYFVLTLSMFVFGVVGTGLQNFVTYSMSLTISVLAGLMITSVVFASTSLYHCQRKLTQ